VTIAKRRRSSSTDDKVEATRKIIRRSLDEITAEVVSELRKADLRAGVSMVVPSRHTLVSIASARDLPPAEWSRMSAIVRQVVGKWLGGHELRGRPLTRAVAYAMIDAPGVTAD
jgi:hypothetical protein